MCGTSVVSTHGRGVLAVQMFPMSVSVSLTWEALAKRDVFDAITYGPLGSVSQCKHVRTKVGATCKASRPGTMSLLGKSDFVPIEPGCQGLDSW